jgi:type V secretory pathway adhesin AidA
VRTDTLGPLPGARVTRNTDQGINGDAVAVDSTVNFTRESYDPQNMHTGSGSDLTVPVTGRYVVSANLHVLTSGDDSVNILVESGAGTLIAAGERINNTSKAFSLSTIAELQKNDRVDILVLCSPAHCTSESDGGQAFPTLALQWVAPS